MNPINMMSLVQAAQRGQNPMGLIQQLAQGNPRAARAMSMMNGKNPAQMREMAYNIAQERGIDLDAYMRSMGLK